MRKNTFENVPQQKMLGRMTASVTIYFHCMEKDAMEKDVSLPNISFWAPWRKESHSGLERHEGETEFQFCENHLSHLQYSLNYNRTACQLHVL